MKNILILLIAIARSFHEKILSNLRFPYRSIREIFHAPLSTRPYIFAQKFDLATPVKSDRKKKEKKGRRQLIPPRFEFTSFEKHPSGSESDKSLAWKQAASAVVTPVVERAGRKGEEKQRECLGSDKGAHCVFHRERERCCARRDAALAERPLRSTRATDGRIARATVPLGHAVSRLATQRSAVSYRVPWRLVVFVEGTVCSRSSTVFTPAFANPLSISLFVSTLAVCVYV